jgi:hypothetical protein
MADRVPMYVVGAEMRYVALLGSRWIISSVIRELVLSTL